MCDLCGDSPSDQAIDHSIDHPFVLLLGTDNDCECGKHLSAHPDKVQVVKDREWQIMVKYGHLVRSVFNKDGTVFAYSVGRSVKDRPELYMSGRLSPETMCTLINLAAQVDDETPLVVGQQYDGVIEDMKVKIAALDNLEAAAMYGALAYFPSATALQILWPDSDGRYPGDPGFDEAWAQPNVQEDPQ